jgi:2-deoxy-D-gluconate 3-dehydrogenase
MAIALAEAGSNIVLIQRDDSNTATRDEIRALGRSATIYTADLAHRDQIKGLVKAVLADGHDISILINCGGVQRRHPAEQFPDEDWDEVRISVKYDPVPQRYMADVLSKVMRVNLDAVFVLARDIGAYMLTRLPGEDSPHRGSIINVASLVSFQGGLNVPAYAAAKGGVAQLTKSLSNQWASRGISVNAVCCPVAFPYVPLWLT